ncbi:MAG: ADP-ribosylglycohydrolase [Paraglaciecola psychrophila]|jgi:ADP-ribosylglycohydrolase
MNTQHHQRAKNTILGALVADAATMGFHWLYSQSRIAEVAPSQPEFRAPTASDYSGNVGYFAHGHKYPGEFSHYGEQARVMLDSMVANGASYDRHHYQDTFRDYFGYGGAYNGYIDRPTRETLDTIYRTEADALAQANDIPFDNIHNNKQGLLIKILAAAKRFQGDELAAQGATLAAAQPNAQQCQHYVTALIEALSGSMDYPGAADEQLPAISKLPALVARYAADDNLQQLCESAIKVTNNAPRALDYGRVVTALLAQLVRGDSINAAIDNAVALASPATGEHLAQAMNFDGDLQAAGRKFALHCDVGSGMASVFANLKSAQSYPDAVRANIYVAGDNCGRAVILGAACGAAFGIGGERGIPQSWIDRLKDHKQLREHIDLLLA